MYNNKSLIIPIVIFGAMLSWGMLCFGIAHTINQLQRPQSIPLYHGISSPHPIEIPTSTNLYNVSPVTVTNIANHVDYCEWSGK